MPTYTITAPNGKTYEIEGPEGASQADVARAVLAQNPEAAQPPKPVGTLKAVGANLAGGIGNALLGFGAAAADYTGASDTAKALDEKRKQLQEWQQEQGGDTLAGMAASGAGAMAPALGIEAAGAAAAPLTGGASILLANLANAGFFGIPAFRDTFNEQREKGAPLGVALQHAFAEAGLATVGGKIIGSGGKILPKALQAGEGVLGKMATAAGEGAVFPEAGRVLEKSIDVANDRQNDKSWLVDPKEAAAGALSFAGLRGAHHAMEAPARTRAAEAQAEQARVDAANKQQAEADAKAKAELDAQRNVPAVTEAGESGETYASQKTIYEALQQAEKDRQAALQAGIAAGRSGDTDAMKEASDAVAEHAKRVSDLTAQLDGTYAPPEAPTPTRTPTQEEDAARLLQLQGGTNKKGKYVPGLWEKAFTAGDTDAAKAHADEIAEIKARQAKTRTIDNPRLDQLNEEEGSTVVTPPDRTPPPAPVEPAAPTPPQMGGQLAGKTRDQIWRDQNLQEEIEGMGANRMDTTRTVQQSLLPPEQGPVGRDAHKALRDQLVEHYRRAYDAGDKDGADRIADIISRLKERMPALPSAEVAPTDVSFARSGDNADTLRAQIEGLHNLDPYSEQLVGRLHDNLNAFAADPERAALASQWLHNLRTGADVSNGRVDTHRSEAIRNELDNLELGKRSEIEHTVKRFPAGPATPEGTKVIRNQAGDRVFPQGTGMLPDRLVRTGDERTAQQRALPGMEPTGRVFSTPALFEKFLGSEALHKMRSAMGMTVQTVARAMKTIAPMREKLARLEQSLADAQAAYDRHRESFAGLTEKARDAHTAALKRLADVEHRLMLEREPLVIEYLKAQQALKFSADVSRDITKAILDNKAMLHESMPGTIEALVREKQAISDVLAKQMDVAKTEGGVTAAQIDQLQLQMQSHMQEVQRLTAELASKRAGFPDAFNEYLRKERSYQKQLSDELATMGKLHKVYSDVKERFDRLEKNQNRRVTVQRDRAAATDAIRQAETGMQATAAAENRQRGIDSEVTKGKHDKVQQLRKELAAAEEEQRAARDARLPKPEREETQADREARDAQQRSEEQAALERGEAQTTERVNATEYNRRKVKLDQLHKEIADLNDSKLFKDEDERRSIQAQIDTKKREAAIYRDLLEGVPESARREDGTLPTTDEYLQSKIDEWQEKVDKRKASVNDPDAPKSTLYSRRDELKDALDTLRLYKRAKQGYFGFDRTAATRAEHMQKVRPATEAPVEGERLPARKIGPLVKKEVTPGDTRTGSPESKKGDNKTSNRNPIRQTGRARGVTAHQAVVEGNRVSAERESQHELEQQQKEDAAFANEVAQRERGKKAPKEEVEAPEVVAKTPKKAKTSKVIEDIDPYEDDNYYDPSGFGGGWEGEHESMMFRSDSDAPVGMSKESAQATTDAVTARWKNAPDVVVVQSVSDLPLRMQGRIKLHKEGGENRRVPGFFDRKTGKVFLIGDELRGAHDAETTLVHEIAGHYGLKGMLGDTYADTMQRLHDGNKDVAAKAKAEMEKDPTLTLHDAVEEVLADMAEKQPNSSMAKRFFYAIKSALFKTFGIKHVSDGEVAQIVANARRHVEKGGPSGPGGGGGADTVLRTAAEEFGRRYQDKRSEVAKLNAAKSHLPLAMEQAMVDMRASLRRTFMLGDKKLGAQANYDLLNADNYVGTAHNVLSNGALKISKDKKQYDIVTSGHSKSFKDVLEDISQLPGKNAEARMDTFYGAMMALRGRRVGWDKLDFKDPAEAQRMGEAALRELAADPKAQAAFDKARDTYHDYNRGLVEFARDTHAITADVAKDLLAHKDYVPFYRVDGDTVNMMMPDGHPVSMGDIRSQPFLHALVGGDQKLMSFSDAVFRNTSVLTNLATRNLASRRIAYHLQDLGKTAGVMQIQRGKGGAGQDVMRFRQKPDPNIKDDDGWRHVVINTKGTAAEHIPSELLAQSVAGSYATLPSMLKAFGAASDLLRSGVTRMPTYILSQTIKDPFNAAMLGNLKRNPVMAALETVKNFGSNMTGKNADGKTLEAHGVLHSNIFNGSPSDMRKVAMQVAGKNQSALGRFLGGLDHAAMTADAATREQHYRDVINAGGSELEAVVGAREMQNFNKRGSSASVQMLSRMIPFFNASIQGLNVLAKSAQGKMTTSELLDSKKKFYTRAAGLATMAVTYAMMMEDDPEWQKMSLRDKLSYIHLPKWMSPTDESMRIPAPFETGMLFYSLPVAMVEGMREDFTPKDWKVVRDLFLNQMPGSGSIMPQLFKGAYDVSRNYNSGTGQAIEPKSTEHLASQERTTPNTTEAAKRFSEQLNSMGVALSPIQIEYLANAYVGQLPQAIATLTNQAFAKESQADVEKPSGHASDLPFVGRFFQNQRGTDDIEHMYEAAANAKEVKATYQHMLQQGRTEDAKSYMDDHRVEIATEKAGSQFTQQMLKLKKAEDAIRNAPKMSAEEKQTRLDKLQEVRQGLADTYRKTVKQVSQQVQ